MSVWNRMRIRTGDITGMNVDAAVNAANKSLSDGGGVNGAIHRAAGPTLCEECARLGGCETGQAKATGAHHMPCRWIIHTVGPIWRGGAEGEDGKLAACYQNSLALAAEVGARTIAFPAISTGAYGFPAERAAEIAVREVYAYLAENDLPETVTFVCYDARMRDTYDKTLKRLAG